LQQTPWVASRFQPILTICRVETGLRRLNLTCDGHPATCDGYFPTCDGLPTSCDEFPATCDAENRVATPFRRLATAKNGPKLAFRGLLVVKKRQLTRIA